MRSGLDFLTGRPKGMGIFARPARAENACRVVVKGRYLRPHHKTRSWFSRFESGRIFLCRFDRVVFSALLVFAENPQSMERGARGKSKR